MCKTSPVIKKYICYSRTSQSILQIIPSCLLEDQSISRLKVSKEDIDALKKFLLFKGNLCTYVINNSTTQEALVKALQSFFDYNSVAQVFLLVADMNRIAKETINQIRLLIEEASLHNEQPIQRSKFIYILLHFPSNMFYTHCYPTLFLEGWQHIYFDTIGEMQDEHCVDIQKWLSACLLEEPVVFLEDESNKDGDGFVKKHTMEFWLKECIHLISKLIAVKKTKDFPPIDPSEDDIQSYWHKIIFSFESDVIIMEKFYSFWQQKAMNELTFQAANASIYYSNCTLSKRVQAAVHSSFVKVSLFFLSIINKELALHSMLSCKTTKEIPSILVLTLYKDILKILPVPDTLEQLQLELNTMEQHICTKLLHVSSPNIPFFPAVFQAMENVINRSLKAVVKPVEINSHSEEEHMESWNVRNVNTPGSDVREAEMKSVIEKAIEIIGIHDV